VIKGGGDASAPSRPTKVRRHIATDALYLWGALRVYAKDGENMGMLTLYYVLLGDFVDPEELLTALYMIASTADGEDDVLQKQFGGRVVDPDGNYE
jgi:hypothetical protein